MQNEGLKNIWAKYQKEIADDHYYYLRSCIRQNFFPGAEYYFLKILREVLGKDVYDDPRHTTCTGIGYHSDIVPFETIQTVVAREFALMTAAGYRNVAVSCVTSFGIYSEILETWREFPKELQKARENLWKATKREFEIPENIAHASDIIYKFRHQIAEKAKYKLVNTNTGKPLQIVEHIGCHYAKMFPVKGIGGAEFPQVLSGMIAAWGGDVVDYPERRHCCGFGFRQYLVQQNRGYSLSNSKKKLESMQNYEPDAIICNCPGCTMFLDRWQYTLYEMEGKRYGQNNESIPVLAYEELAALVLGFEPWNVGLQMHEINTESLLDKMGIAYNPDEKYLDKNKQPIGSFNKTGCLSCC